MIFRHANVISFESSEYFNGSRTKLCNYFSIFSYLISYPCQVNLLVATSVAEEGLDIRQCNVVIRFDLAKTVLAYIQSRGRARKPGSDYILMVERYIACVLSECLLL